MAKTKLSEYKEDYYSFSGKLSDINRQIAFAGIALIWIFKQTINNEIVLDPALVSPARLIIIALGIDIFHYIYQTITWSIFYTIKKAKHNSEDYELDSPIYLNITAWVLFGFKILFVLIAYFKIFFYLSDKLIK